LEELIGRMLFGTVAGVLAGLWPLIKGVNSQQASLGVAGFFASLISGAVLGIILALPIAWLFSYLIKKNTKSTASDAESNPAKT